MNDKTCSLVDAAQLVQDGQTVTFGGTLLQRVPAAFVRELARQGRRNLELVKPSPAYDIDLLAAAGCVNRVQCGIVTFEQPFGMAPNYRRAVESGRLRLIEHACITVMSGMRAASFGLPFLPVLGLTGSDIPAASGFKTVTDPYSGAELIAVPAIRPDWAVIHVPESDAAGNARIYGSPTWDRIMSRAARRVVVITEVLLSSETMSRQPELTVIPEVLVHAVVHAPRGALPTSCYPIYGVDEEHVWRYLKASESEVGLQAYLQETAVQDRTTAPLAV